MTPRRSASGAFVMGVRRAPHHAVALGLDPGAGGCGGSDLGLPPRGRATLMTLSTGRSDLRVEPGDDGGVALRAPGEGSVPPNIAARWLSPAGDSA